jgi:penicillin-binding protein 1A
VYSADGKVIANLHGEIDRDPVDLDDMPKHLRDATIAIEDRRFYEHRGLDVRGIARAVTNNIGDGNRQGGSTISQQLAKNLYFHGKPRTIWRKAEEAVLSLGLEGLTDKDSILEAYLNTAYFGRGVYGVQAASRSYFRKDVDDLDLSESAFLAGLVHMPARYDFTTTASTDEQQQRRTAAVARRDRVLDAMVDAKYISRAEADEASQEDLPALEAPVLHRRGAP